MTILAIFYVGTTVDASQRKNQNIEEGRNVRGKIRNNKNYMVFHIRKLARLFVQYITRTLFMINFVTPVKLVIKRYPHD